MSILENIQGHEDLLHLTERDRKELCTEIREFLVSHVSKTGGHLASNLGVVELSVALETVFDTRKDRLVFDVGHQAYVHKILTGRQEGFDHLRQFGGMAGFPKPGESQTDAFTAGHASSSVSIALGMARARTMQHENYHVAALIGDGATTGGVSYEGLNDAGDSKEPLIVILNDNKMSIDHNVGGMSRHLSRLRMNKSYFRMKSWFRKVTNSVPGGHFVYRCARNVKDSIKRILLPNTIFESMGFTYLGPVDGHDLESLISLLEIAKEARRPVLIHVITKKGCGYLPAEENPSKFHGIGKFDPLTGRTPDKKDTTFSDAFGQTMLHLAATDDRVCAITAAMPSGTGLLNFKEQYPARTFDVGIAEEHAVSMAGGLAKQGMVPVVAIYSTFLQRAYDMILQDVCMLHLHVVFAIDRAGLVGEDGETPHGVFDVGFMRQAPGMVMLCPGSVKELWDMMTWAVERYDGPVAVRYPRGGNRSLSESCWKPGRDVTETGALSVCRQGRDVTLITYGVFTDNVMKAAALLEAHGISSTVLRLLTVAPLPVDEIMKHLSPGSRVVIAEEACAGSGIRQDLAWELQHRCRDLRIDGMDLGRQFVQHGALNTLYENYGLDDKSIAEYVQEVLKHEN